MSAYGSGVFKAGDLPWLTQHWHLAHLLADC